MKLPRRQDSVLRDAIEQWKREGALPDAQAGMLAGTITDETLLKPRPNYHYDVAMSCRNDMSHIAIREIPPNRFSGRELDPLALSTCQSPSAPK